MSNIATVRPKSTITTSDGVERVIKFTMNAFADLEEKYGSIDEAIQKMDGGSISAIRYILWLGLVEENSALTEREVGQIIEMRDFKDILKEITLAMGFDLPEKDEKEQTDPK